MSKSKKEPYADGISSSSLRRTINNAPSSRRSEDKDGYSRTSRSKSSDSSPERKKSKFGRPVGRGSESGIIFDKGELKKIFITIRNKLAKPPLLHFTNPETITPIRRPDEGKRPIFNKASKEDSDSTEERTSSSRGHPIEGKWKGESRKRYDSPEHRRRRSRRDLSGSRRKRRRNRSTPSRHSCSSDSSSSSEDRRKKKHYYRMRSEREREERKRKEYDNKMARACTAGMSLPYSRDRMKLQHSVEDGDSSSKHDKDSVPPHQPSTMDNAIVRPIYPPPGVRVVRPPPPYAMMRPGMRPFGPPGPFPRVPPGYRPPPRPGYYPPPFHPHPAMPPIVPFRPMPRVLRPPPPRGVLRPGSSIHLKITTVDE